MNQCAPDSSKRGPWSLEFDINGSHVLRDIDFENLQEEGAFVPESVIHALPTYLHCAHQLVGRRGGKALLREQAHRLPKCFLLIEVLLQGHFFFVFLIVCFSYATYPPSMVRLAPVMKPASSDAR